MVSKNKKTHIKQIRKGLSIYKTGNSPFWSARIWIGSERKYVVRSTKETTRLDAIEVAEEIFAKLQQEKFLGSIPNKNRFSFYIDLLLKQQNAMSGKSRSDRFAKDDEKIIKRKDDGILEFFGDKDITSITTYELRDYLSVLDDNRDKELSPSSKTKHLTIIGKIFKIAYERDVIDRIPLIPKVSKKDNPRPSFSDEEYKVLLKTTREVANEGVKVRGVLITDELYYFIVFLVHSFLRPTESEIFAIKYRDIKIKDSPKRLEIKVSGKTGFRTVSTMPDAVDFFLKLQEMNAGYKDTDYLFFNDYPNRSTALRNINRQFNYILNLADIKETSDGQTRSPYALRHYSLQTRLIKSKGKVNIFNLAKNAGTSVEQLERFYLKNLALNDEMIENLQTF